MRRMQSGNTLPELLMALGILVMIFSIVTLTLLRGHRLGIQGAQIDTFLADIRDQQTKAMVQNTGGQGTHYDFGVYLGGDFYTLFRGSSYNSSDPYNFVVNLEEGLSLTNITFPSSTIVFEKGSGGISGYSALADSFEITDSGTGNVKVVELNRYGVPLE